MHVCFVPADPNGYVDGFREIYTELKAEPFPGDVIVLGGVPGNVQSVLSNIGKHYRVVRRVYPSGPDKPCDVILMMRPEASPVREVQV